MSTTTKERPVIFSAPMINAILEGRKTMTRRVIKPQPERPPGPCAYVPSGWALEGLPNEHGIKGCSCEEVKCRWWEGERLWLKEAAYIAPPNFGDPTDGNATDREGRRRVVGYAASMCGEAVRCAMDYGVKKTSPIFMPRWASRITLEITDVRVERLNAIAEADCWAEGIEAVDGMFRDEIIDMAIRIGCCIDDAKPTFAALWDSINGKRPGYNWASSPWVWVISFRRLESSS